MVPAPTMPMPTGPERFITTPCLPGDPLERTGSRRAAAGEVGLEADLTVILGPPGGRSRGDLRPTPGTTGRLCGVPPTRRDAVRIQLLELARADGRVTGAAITGSAAAGTQDEWSDIDLFFGVSEAEPAEVLDTFTAYLYGELGALHHFDLVAGSAVCRGFLLDDLLEVDLGFTPASEFRSFGAASFQVVFGEAAAPSPTPDADVDQQPGRLRHHVLHARSHIRRGRPW